MQTSFPRLKTVEPLSEKRLLVTFVNGTVKVYDCGPLLKKPAFSASTMITSWRTERMIATVLGPEHLDDLQRLHADAGVMRWLSADGAPLSGERTRAALDDSVRHWSRHGFGMWAFHDRASGRFIGRGGLKQYVLSDLDGRREVGLAYAVVSEHWNAGFATEMASGTLSVAFGRLGLERVGSWTLPANEASQRVMEKLGFRYQGDFEFAGLVHRYYFVDSAGFVPVGAQGRKSS